MKALLRDVVSSTASVLGLTNLKTVCRRKLVILTFHRVLPAELRARYPLPGLAVTPEELRWVLTRLLPVFECRPLSAAVRYAREAHPEAPVLAVTFDDGQWDNLAFAAPVLRELGVAATFYLPTDFIGSRELLWHDSAAFAWQRMHAKECDMRMATPLLRDAGVELTDSIGPFMERLKQLDPKVRGALVDSLIEATSLVIPEWARLMTWDEVRQLAEQGHEIGSHSCSHPLLPQLDRAAQMDEFARSSQDLQSRLGTQPVSFCYPNGSFDSISVACAREAGYENAVTTRWGINAREQSEYQLLRCDIDARRLVDRNGQLSESRLSLRLSGLQQNINS